MVGRRGGRRRAVDAGLERHDLLHDVRRVREDGRGVTIAEQERCDCVVR